MKICILGNAQSKHITRWAEFFRDRGHTVSIVSVREAKVDGVAVIVPKIPFTRWLRRSESFDENRTSHFAVYLGYAILAVRIRKILRTVCPEIVMSITLENNGVLSLISGFHPTSIHHMGEKTLSVRSETSLLVRLLVKRIMKFGDLFQTGDTAGILRHQELGAEPHKIVINNWGIDVSQFAPVHRTAAMRERLAGDAEHLFIVVRPLISEYGVESFVQAIAHVASLHRSSRFVVVGGGPERERLESLARSLRVDGLVSFVGHVPFSMLPAYIAAADFYVETAAPRFPEGRTWWGHRIRASATGNPFSQTGMMALASGCIPIPARRPGLDSFVPASISSLIWPAGSPEHLATMFNHAVDFTPDELARLKSECRDFALRRFDWNVNAPELERQLISLAESHYHVPASYTPVTDTSNRSPSAPFNSLTKKIH